MKCRFCGEEMPEGSKFCPNCGALAEPCPHPHEDEEQRQPRKQLSSTPYIIFAILTTLLCCLPFGIAAIVFASKINARQSEGDYEGARSAADKAKIFCIIGAAGGLIVTCIYLIIAGVMILSSDSSGNVDDLIRSVINEQEDSDGDIYGGSIDGDDTDDDAGDGDSDGDTHDGGDIAAAPAQIVGALGETWDTYTVQINDKVLAFPCTVADVEAAGLKIDEEYTPEDYMVDAQDYTLAYFEDANGNELMCDIVNTSDEAKAIKECLAGGVSVDGHDLEEGGLTVMFPGGIQIGSSKDDVIGKYGEPDDTFEDDDTMHMYTWYGTDSYYARCEVYTDAATGLITHMEIENYE